MKLRTCLLALVVVMLFVNAVWATHYAKTYLDGDLVDTYYGYTALQTAITEANDSEADSIFYYGDPDTIQVASDNYFYITEDGLKIVYYKKPCCSDGFWITCDNVHMCGYNHGDEHNLVIDTGDDYGIEIVNGADNNIIEDCDIKTGDCGVENLGTNNDMQYLNIHDCDAAGIHSDGVNASIYRVIIDDCGINGIVGHGSGNSLTIDKVLISNCGSGCYFFNNISVDIDRTTVYDFGDYGIENTSDADYVHCKRCLVYKDSFGEDDYCYKGVTFDNHAIATNKDNVAMGDDGDCVGTHDFSGCVGTDDRISYDNYPEYKFDANEADIGTWSTPYTNVEYGAIESTDSRKMLGFYGWFPFFEVWVYCFNVGYDTDLDSTVIYKRYLGNKPDEIVIAAFPNPFNSSVCIDAPDDVEVSICDLSGHKLTELPAGESIWKPDCNIGSGAYIIRVITPDGQSVTKNIIYMK